MITRRYRDFAQLIQQLPPLPVSLPPKQWYILNDLNALKLYIRWNVLEPEFVAQRQTKLDTFLQNITNHPVVRESVAVLSFLGGTVLFDLKPLFMHDLLAISTTLYDHEEITGNKRDVVHLRVLNRYVNPGDILLFRCRTRTSQLQRSVPFLKILPNFINVAYTIRMGPRSNDCQTILRLWSTRSHQRRRTRLSIGR